MDTLGYAEVTEESVTHWLDYQPVIQAAFGFEIVSDDMAEDEG